MGIQGLLRGLKPLIKLTSTGSKPNIRQFANRALAVDVSSWLHKGGYACAELLVESGSSDKTCVRIYTNYIIKRCEELLYNANIATILLVFDGPRCPLKADTNKEREQKRARNISEARKLKREGKHSKASEKYRACVKVTDTMTKNVAAAVKSRFSSANGSNTAKVRCIFSPYEADAQLAQLCVEGHADAVVTEDSDVILYSVACGLSFPIIYKLDKDSGSCDVISMNWLLLNEQLGHNVLYSTSLCNKSKSTFAGILRFMSSREKREPGAGRRLFIQACVLSGCDYSSSLPGIGLVTAFKLIKDNNNKNPDQRFHHILREIKRKIMSSSSSISTTFDFDEYEMCMAKSEAAFYYHLVYKTQNNCVDHFISPPHKNHENLHIASPEINRFNNDLSFLGLGVVDYTISTSSSQSYPNNDGNTISSNTFKVNRNIFETTSSLSRPFLDSPKLPKKRQKVNTNNSEKEATIMGNLGSKRKIVSTATIITESFREQNSLSSISSTENLLEYNPFQKFALVPDDSQEVLESPSVESNRVHCNYALSQTKRNLNLMLDSEHSSSPLIEKNVNAKKKSLKSISDIDLKKGYPLSGELKKTPQNKKSCYFATGSTVVDKSNETSKKGENFDTLLNFEEIYVPKSNSISAEYDSDGEISVDDSCKKAPVTLSTTRAYVPFVSPFASTSSLKHFKNCLPKSQNKKKTKNTIMAGFRKQQMLYQNGLGKNSKKKKVTTSIKTFLGRSSVLS